MTEKEGNSRKLDAIRTKEYNERFGKKAGFYFSLDFVEGWEKELKIMNG